MRWMFLLLTCGLAAPASSGALYKCVSRSGEASYQSQPCAAGLRTAWVRELVALAAPAAIAQPPPLAARPSARPDAPAARGARAAGTRPRAADTRCAAARRSAALQRDRFWNRLTFRQRSELDARVARACAR
jgi:hypothetical protein